MEANDMKMANPIIALALAAALCGATGAEAASFGNPVGGRTTKGLVIGLETEHVTTPIGNDQANSNRYLVKGAYRVLPSLDLTMRLGAGDIDVLGEIAGNQVALNTNPQFAWGGGLRFEPLKLSSSENAPRLVLAADGLVLRSSGVGEMDLVFPSAVLRERFETDYTWREVQGTAAVVFSVKTLTPYVGASVRGVDGEVRRVQTDLSGSAPSVVADETEEFGSSISPYALAGFDYRVGRYFSMSSECFFRDSGDYGFFVGFSEAAD
jgi:hypothetical protein